MSGVVKGVKKVFKKVTKVVKKVWKPVAIAVAAYFTAGLALSAFSATSAFAASMPGFAGGGFAGLGIGAGKVAGAGVFSKVAGAIGLGGGLAKGAAIANTGTMAGAMAGGTFASTSAVYSKAAMSVAGGAAGSGAAAGAVGGAAVARAGLSFADKLLIAKAGTDFVGGLLAPSQKDIIREQHKWDMESRKFQGAFYGMERDGTMAPQPDPATGKIPEQNGKRNLIETPNVPRPAASRQVKGADQREAQQMSKPQARQLITDLDEDEDLQMPRMKGVRYLA